MLDLLKEVGMIGCKPSDTSIKANCRLGTCIEGKLVDKSWYQRLVGKLIYLSHTKPIAHMVSVVS